LAAQTRDASEWKERADFYEQADLPPSLFPAELGYHADVDVAKWDLSKHLDDHDFVTSDKLNDFVKYLREQREGKED